MRVKSQSLSTVGNPWAEHCRLINRSLLVLNKAKSIHPLTISFDHHEDLFRPPLSLCCVLRLGRGMVVYLLWKAGQSFELQVSAPGTSVAKRIGVGED